MNTKKRLYVTMDMDGRIWFWKTAVRPAIDKNGEYRIKECLAPGEFIVEYLQTELWETVLQPGEMFELVPKKVV